MSIILQQRVIHLLAVVGIASTGQLFSLQYFILLGQSHGFAAFQTIRAVMDQKKPTFCLNHILKALIAVASVKTMKKRAFFFLRHRWRSVNHVWCDEAADEQLHHINEARFLTEITGWLLTATALVVPAATAVKTWYDASDTQWHIDATKHQNEEYPQTYVNGICTDPPSFRYLSEVGTVTYSVMILNKSNYQHNDVLEMNKITLTVT